jgi:predicted transcriptional regulator of viral defense system
VIQSTRHAEQVFRSHGGIVRTSQALAAGVHPRTLYRLRDQGLAERVSRGVYRWADLAPLGAPDLVTVATRAPQGVICLLSALDYHDTTTHIPHQVYLAVPRSAAAFLRITQPPVRVFRFSAAAFALGVERHRIDGVSVKLYSPAKTVVDCFRLRRTVGTDVAVEALRRTLQLGKGTPAEITALARLCRVERVITPYLEAMV